MLLWPSVMELLKTARSRIVITVKADVIEVDPEDQDDSGAKHQIFTIRVAAMESGRSNRPEPGDLLYVAVRFGDREGIPEPIDNLAAGQPIELRGAYIPPEAARLRAGAERLGVLHFTHRPLGWVRYQGRTYQ